MNRNGRISLIIALCLIAVISAKNFDSTFLSDADDQLKLLLDSKFDYNTFEHKKIVGKELGITYVEKIMRSGYMFEEHKVVTEDGYILSVWRIPNKLKNTDTENKTKRKPIILQHGLLDDSFTFLALEPKNILPFMLVDLGYDVWLPNSRGNMFSNEHIDPFKDSAKFYSDYWNFSFAEMSKYDFPATIKYVLDKTGYEKLDYIGHSQGTFIYYLHFLTYPDFINTYIDKFVSIGTIVTIYNSVNLKFKYLGLKGLKNSRNIENF